MQRDALHQAIGAAKKDAGRDARFVLVEVTHRGKGQRQTATLTWRLDRAKLREAWRREGRYLLRTNLIDTDPAKLWAFYLQLTEVEQAFKELKGDLSIRPIHHRLDHRIEAHIFVSFLAYPLQVTLKARLRPSATGLTPRAALEKFATMQMLDVHLPTTDGREIILTRYTHPEKDLQLLLDQLHLTLPEQRATNNPRRGSAPRRRRPRRRPEPLHETALRVVQTHASRHRPRQRKRPRALRESAKSG
jgi:hypothetical protein